MINTFSEIEHLLVEALSVKGIGRSMKTVCELAGVNVGTVYRWKSNYPKQHLNIETADKLILWLRENEPERFASTM